MAVGDLTQGRRWDGEPHLMAAGDYGHWPEHAGWWCRTPNGDGGNLSGHEVVEHEDGTITVSPSILVSDSDGQRWHGYLEHGVWREV